MYHCWQYQGSDYWQHDEDHGQKRKEEGQERRWHPREKLGYEWDPDGNRKNKRWLEGWMAPVWYRSHKTMQWKRMVEVLFLGLQLGKRHTGQLGVPKWWQE